MGNGAVTQGAAKSPQDQYTAAAGDQKEMGNGHTCLYGRAVPMETTATGTPTQANQVSVGSGPLGPLPLPLPSAAQLEGPSVVDVNEATKIEFLTDVEGNWEYFLRWVSLSEILYWDGEDRGAWGPGSLKLRDASIFVFGGDAPDKGPGDIRFVRILLDLKARYRDRVFILLGNRDVNKLRFSSELVPGVEPFELPWDNKALPLDTWLASHPECPKGSQVSLLKWMLHFMGCQNTTFNTRRHELALLHPSRRIQEEDVLASFRGCVDPVGEDPWMLRLIQAGKLALVIGDSLFVHGGLHDAALGKVPGATSKASTSLRDWVMALNAWKESQVQDFLARPYWVKSLDTGRRVRGAEDLILYGTPGFPDNATVVYYNPFLDGNPQLLSPQVETYLNKSGIKRAFSGHQPHGQSPTVVRHPTSGLLRVTADTSYSCPGADKLFNPANMRGSVVSVIRVQGDVLEIQGVLADGCSHGCKLHRNPSQDTMPDILVGRQLTDGAWIKTVLQKKDSERCTVQAVFGKGFTLQTQDMHFGKACLKLKQEFAVQKLATPLSNLLPEWLQPAKCDRERTFGAEEDPMSRGAMKLATMTLFNREDFMSAETYVFNIGGVVEKVYDRSSRRSISRSGTDLQLEQTIVTKINDLIAAGKRVIFLTNNSNVSRRATAANLAKKGINLPADQFYKHILTTSYTCAWFCKNSGIKNPFIVCSDTGIIEEFKEMGLAKYVATIKDNGAAKEEYHQKATYSNVCDLVKQAPDIDAVIIGWDQQLTTLKIDVATAYLNWGTRESDSEETAQIPLIGCSSDTGGILGVTPDDYLADRKFNDRQVRTVGNGLMAQLVCDTAGNRGVYFDVGNPSDLMLEALTRPSTESGLGVNPKTTILIGDVLRTDIAMANHGGMRSLLVFSGETAREDFLTGDHKGGGMPTWILNSFADV